MHPPNPAQTKCSFGLGAWAFAEQILHAFTGKQPFFNYPRILGHELALEIVGIGPTTVQHDLQVGDHCCVRPYMNCGECNACRRGITNACTKLQVLGVHRDGGMRELINVPIDKVHKSTILQRRGIGDGGNVEYRRSCRAAGEPHSLANMS